MPVDSKSCQPEQTTDPEAGDAVATLQAELDAERFAITNFGTHG